MNYFITYSPIGVLIMMQDGPRFDHADDVTGFIDDILKCRDSSSCLLEGAKEALEDGEIWAGSNAKPELLEWLHSVIVNFENTPPNGYCRLI
jgi:hypothetical protein